MEKAILAPIMASKAVKFLEEHQSSTPSRFEEEVRWRQENEIWLRLSRSVKTLSSDPALEDSETL